MSEAKSLVSKLAEVMKEIGHIKKRGRNEFHKYDYVLEADLCDAVRERLASRNVMMIPSVTSVGREPVGGESDQFITSVMVEYTLMDGDSDQSIRFSMPGAGADKGDKGVYKAITGSDKYALMKAFLIPTGDDPEGDAETDASAEGFKRNNTSQQKAFADKRIAQERAKRNVAELPQGEQVLTGVLYDVSSEMPTKNKKGTFVKIDVGGCSFNVFEKTIFPILRGLVGKEVNMIVKKEGAYLNFVALNTDPKRDPDLDFAQASQPDDENLPF